MAKAMVEPFCAPWRGAAVVLATLFLPGAAHGRLDDEDFIHQAFNAEQASQLEDQSEVLMSDELRFEQEDGVALLQRRSQTNTRPASEPHKVGGRHNSSPAPTAQRKPVLWVHLHKAAGTFMCATARRAGERVVLPNANCNWKNHDDYPDSGNYSKSVSCSERSSYFRKAGFTYGQLEHEMWPADLCWGEFAYGLAVREPIELILSELNFNFILFSGKRKAYLLAALKARLAAGAQPAGPKQQSPEWKFFDNIQTRLLADAMDVPAGHIGREHLARAQALLANFTVVTRVEDLHTPAGQRAVFEKLGWNYTQLAQHGTLKKENHINKDRFNFTKSEAEWLRGLNKWDIELYRSVRGAAA